MQQEYKEKGLCQCGCGDLAPLAPQTVLSKGLIKGQPYRYIKGHHQRHSGPGLNPAGLCKCGCGQETPLATSSRLGNVIGTPMRVIYGHGNGTRKRGPGPNPSGLCMCGCGQKTRIADKSNRGNIKGTPVRYLAGHGNCRQQITASSDVFTLPWLQSEAGAWVMGLWAADGYFRKNKFSIASIDKDGLVKAAQAFRVGPASIHSYQRPDSRDVHIFQCNIRLVKERLERLGVYSGPKTATVTVPPSLEYSRHFWRGVMDGDGYASKTRLGHMGLSTASRPLCEALSTYVSGLGLRAKYTTLPKGRKMTIMGRPSTAKMEVYQFGWAGAGAQQLAKELYENCLYTIERKRARALALFSA